MTKIEILNLQKNYDYKSTDNYIDTGLITINRHISKILSTKYTTLITEFLNTYNIKEIYGTAWGGVGCGDLQTTIYKTPNSEFAEEIICDGNYNISIEYEENFEYVNQIIEIRTKMNEYWNDEIKPLAKLDLKNTNKIDIINISDKIPENIEILLLTYYDKLFMEFLNTENIECIYSNKSSYNCYTHTFIYKSINNQEFLGYYNSNLSSFYMYIKYGKNFEYLKQLTDIQMKMNDYWNTEVKELCKLEI